MLQHYHATLDTSRLPTINLSTTTETSALVIDSNNKVSKNSGTVALTESTARLMVSLRTDDAYVMYV